MKNSKKSDILMFGFVFFFADFWCLFIIIAAIFVMFVVVVVIVVKKKQTKGETKELFTRTGVVCACVYVCVFVCSCVCVCVCVCREGVGEFLEEDKINSIFSF